MVVDSMLLVNCPKLLPLDPPIGMSASQMSGLCEHKTFLSALTKISSGKDFAATLRLLNKLFSPKQFINKRTNFALVSMCNHDFREVHSF